MDSQKGFTLLSELACDVVPSGVITVIMDVLRIVATGVPSEDAVCEALAQELDAAIAAYVALDPAHGAAGVILWPPATDQCKSQQFLEQLRTEITPLLARFAAAPKAQSLSTNAGSCIPGCSDLAEMPLEVPGRGPRMVLLGRARPFDREEVHLLDWLRSPLSNLIGVAGEQRSGAPADWDATGRLLTAREIEVLQLMADGLLARTIATRLAVSVRTVHKHLGSIYRKLDVCDRLSAARLADRLGLLAGEETPAARQMTDHMVVVVPIPATHRSP